MRRKDDVLLKAAFEETFPDLLTFVFGDSADIFDLEKGVQFLDKELAELFPDLEKKGGSRFVDLLAKVFLKSGDEKWILIHIEIQSGYDQDFGLRMFQYFYRIFDKHKVPVSALAVFTGERRNTCESFFEYDFMRTHLLYQFNSFHIMDYADEELLGMNNRFAIVILAAQKALKSNKLSAFQLADHRLAIARTIIQNKQYSIEQIRYLLYFLKTFIRIESKEINLKFDKAIEEIARTEKAMSIIEAIKNITREEAQAEVISSLFRKTAYTPAQIADITELDLDFILEIKADMEDGNLKSPSEF